MNSSLEITNSTITPRHDYVLIRMPEKESKEVKTRGGLIIPEDPRDPKTRPLGTIAKVGPGVPHHRTMEVVPVELSEGQEVMFNLMSAQFITVDGALFALVRQGDVLAVLNKGP